MKNFLIWLFVLGLSTSIHAQLITGNVVDANGLGYPGVNVLLLSNPAVATTTDLDGNFSIAAAPGDVLEFSMLGFQTKKQKASANMRVVLEEDTETLQEVVVVGYGTKKAGSITGSVAQVRADDIMRMPAQSAIQAIQGKAAGVNIVTNDEPGANPSIRVRGLGTLMGSRDPLYIIDGVESYSMNNLAPGDIQTMDILKDASSLAIYGQKGANGVVVITTKKGAGKLKVTYDAYYGQKAIQRKVDMANAQEFLYYSNYALGSSSYFSSVQPYETNWLDEITRSGEVMNNAIALSGGTDQANYYFGVTNYKEKGILNGTRYERTNISSRNSFSFLDNRVKVSQALNVAIVNNSPKPISAFTTAYKQSPLVPVRFSNGAWGVPLRNTTTGQVDPYGTDRFNNVGNPVAQLEYTNEHNKNLLLFGSVKAEFKITDELQFTSNFGARYDQSKGYTFTPSRSIWLSQNPTQDASNYPTTSPVNTLQKRTGDSYNWNLDNFLTYDKTWDAHHFTATLGMSRSTRGDSEYLSATRWNVPENANYWSLDMSAHEEETSPDLLISNSISTPVVSLAYFGRLDYEYDQRFLFTASLRREGISAFQSDKRWENFMAVSGGWVLSNESFLEGVSGINFLKLRAGYGEVGNGNTSNSLNIPVFASNYDYAIGGGSNLSSGSHQPYQVDPNLTWETMREYDLGIDFRTLNNRLSLSLDFYDRESRDIILPVQLPTVISPDRVTLNTGVVSNKGAELALKWEDTIGENWRYWIGGNVSYNKNELKSVSNAFFADYIGGSINNGQWTKQVLVGEALGSFYVYDVLGFTEEGNFMYSTDRVVAGSYIPDYTFGINLGFAYKNWDFSADAYGVAGNKLYNGKKAQRFGNENIEADILTDFWYPSNPNAAHPTPFNTVPVSSTYYIEKGDYLRINNLTVGYTLPELTQHISKIRVYATAVNPFLFTKFSGFSPELSGNNNSDPLGSAGIELDAYPTNKTFLFGLNVSF